MERPAHPSEAAINSVEWNFGDPFEIRRRQWPADEGSATASADPSAPFEVESYGATTSDFYVAIILLVARNTSGCSLSVHNPLEFGFTFTEDSVSCGLPEFGPHASGTAELHDGKDWRLKVRAAASDGLASQVATGYVTAQAGDTFTVFSDGTPVPVSLRLRQERDIQNMPFAWLRFEVEIVKPGPPQSAVFYRCWEHGNVSSSGSCVKISSPGELLKLDEIPIGSFPPGTRLRMQTALEGVTESGGCCGSLVDPKEAEAEVSVSLCSTLAAGVLQGASTARGACDTGDLRLVSVEPIQAVEGAPLIAGKDAVIAVDIESTFEQPVVARIDFSIQEPPFGERLWSEEIVIPDCPGPKRFYFPRPSPATSACEPDFALEGLRAHGLEPIAGGASFGLTATASSEANESDSTNNDAASSAYPVKDTLFSMVYTQVECPRSGSCATDPLDYGSIPPFELSDAVTFGDLQVSGSFPVSDGGFSSPFCKDAVGRDCRVSGDSRKCTGSDTDLSMCAGMRSDFARARVDARAFQPSMQRVVLLLPKDYLLYHRFRNNSGWFFPGINDLAVVKAESPSGNNPFALHFNTIPHELVHSFGSLAHVPTSPDPGYWVGCRPGFPRCEAGTTNLMNPAAAEPPQAWIDEPTYAGLLLPQLKVGVDPTVLDITGTWKRNGSVEIDFMLEFPGGIASPVVGSGTGAIELMDDAGGVLVTRSVDLDFRFQSEDEHSTILSSDVGMIGVALDYPPETAIVRFRDADRVILEIDPLSRTLRDAIRAIPDRGYAKNPAERRAALLAKVGALEGLIAKKKFLPAVESLEKDIRDKVEKWIIEYQGQPSELSKTKVLEQIDRVSARLSVREK